MRKFLFILMVSYLPSHKAADQTSRTEKLKQIFEIDTETQSDEKCECIPYYRCNDIGVIDIRSNDCLSYLDRCCNSESKTNVPMKPPPAEHQGCGFRNPDGVDLRIDGDENNEAQYGEFPWMVVILSMEFAPVTGTIFQTYKCGGALIHAQAVLTAAHHVFNKEGKYIVRAGEWDTHTIKERYPHQDRNIRKMVIHKDYYADAALNDVAILFLDQPFEISSLVSPICLPSQDFVIPAGTRCFASGWGKDVFEKAGKYPIILKKVELSMVEFNDCQNQLRTTRLGRHFMLDKSFVCAGGGKGTDTCKGDGGSPLACPIAGQTNRYQQIGIVSWGIGCGENGIPGAYVNVAMFRRWIDEQMNIENLEINSYKF